LNSRVIPLRTINYGQFSLNAILLHTARTHNPENGTAWGINNAVDMGHGRRHKQWLIKIMIGMVENSTGLVDNGGRGIGLDELATPWAWQV
jgi:hypothetical protein